jgi:hypothetical protein
MLIASILTSPPYSGFGALLLLAIYAWSLADLYQLYKKDEKPTVETGIKCSKCGFRNELNSDYCIKCGRRIQYICPQMLTINQSTDDILR